MNELERQLNESLRRNLDDVEPVVLRPDRLRQAQRARRLIAALGVMVAISAVAGAVWLSTGILSSRQLSPREPASGGTPQPAETAVIECLEDGAHVLTPLVRAHSNGVRIRIENLADHEVFSFRAVSDARDNEGGRLDRDGVTAFTTYAAPGEKLIGCFRTEDDVPYWETDDPAYDRFTIVDPDGLWVSSELECGAQAERSTIETAISTTESPSYEEMARREVPGIRPDDVFQRPGYPEGEWHFEPRTVLREGRRIAGLMFVEAGETWDILVHACPGSGIGPP